MAARHRFGTATLLVSTALELGVSLVASTAFARCGDMPGDAQAVADARIQVAADCTCSDTVPHGTYVACAAGIANARATAGTLPMSCKGAVKRCAARSTCGKPGAVTCCRTRPGGSPRCSTKRDPGRCTAPLGGSACVGVFASCCDACGAGGCVVPTTSTTTTTTTTVTSTTALACGGTIPFCSDGGRWPGGGRCARHIGPAGTFCACYPPGVTPCVFGPYPVCGGGYCLEAGKVCQAVFGTDGGLVLFEGCTCVDADGTCAPPAPGEFMCTVGPCPTGSVCASDAAGLGACGCSP